MARYECAECESDCRVFVCVDCKVNTLHIQEYYMVTNAVWEQGGLGRGMLCVGCLELRIGRTLIAEDFPALPVNLGVFPKSERLSSRSD